ncbi:MAG: hypothetical protein JZD40_00025 [Sulfolobus sp.]|nr:hypothetical protein [Sulfolobus sp.]
MVWILEVQIQWAFYSRSKKLIEELKKIPDVAIKLMYRFFDNPVYITIRDLKEEEKEYSTIIYKKKDSKVYLTIYDGCETIKVVKEEEEEEEEKVICKAIEERTAPAENDEKAVPVIVEFTRYALAKITKDAKYIIESDTSLDDVTQIKVIKMKVFPMPEIVVKPVYQNLIDSLEISERCKVTQKYNFNTTYIYPHIIREVHGAILCCKDRCYLYIRWESQGGDFKGGRPVIINLHGKEPTKEILEKELKTRKDLLIEIENHVTSSHH